MADGAGSRALRYLEAGDFLPGFLKAVVLQDPSAIVASLALGARPGEAVWTLAQLQEARRLIWRNDGGIRDACATDIDASRANMVRALGRMGLDFARSGARRVGPFSGQRTFQSWLRPYLT